MKHSFLIVLTFFSVNIAFSQNTRLMVSDIQAQAIGNGEIQITWQVPTLPETMEPNTISIQLYRTQEPKAGSKALEGIAPIATLPYTTRSYTDYLGAKGTYYYTAILLQSGQGLELVVPGTNSTVEGIQIQPASPGAQEIQRETIQEGPNKSTGLRNTPLPYLRLMLNQSPNKDTPLNPERSQEEAKLHAPGTEAAMPRIALPPQHIFRQEQENESVGEDFILQEIVNNHLKTENYQLAEQSLRDFLSIKRSKDATDRGTFYLGEALLYQGKYRQALSCFLAVQDRFPDLTTRWIQAALNGYQLPIVE